MEGETGAEDGAEHNLVGDGVTLAGGERRGDLFLGVVEGAAYLEGHNLAHAFEVVAEAHFVTLYVNVT